MSAPIPRYNIVFTPGGMLAETASMPPAINNTEPTNQQPNPMVARRDGDECDDGDDGEDIVGKRSEISG